MDKDNIPLETFDAIAELQDKQQKQDQQQQHHGKLKPVRHTLSVPTLEITTTPRASSHSFALTHPIDVTSQFREALATNQCHVIIEHLRARKPLDFNAIFDASEGETLLMLACRHGRRDVVLELTAFESFTSMCQKTNKDRKTALTIAAEMGHAEVVRVIVDYLLDKRDDAIIDQRDSVSFAVFALIN